MAVMQALLNIRSERRWLRYLGKHLRHLFPYQLKQPGYNKRLNRPGADQAGSTYGLAPAGSHHSQHRGGGVELCQSNSPS